MASAPRQLWRGAHGEGPPLKSRRIAGVEVGVNWSALVIVLLIVAGRAGGQLPSAYPGHRAVVYVMAAVMTAVLFFSSLLGHELAHTGVARRNGLDVQSITLWLLGGVAQLKGEPRSPGGAAGRRTLARLDRLVPGERGYRRRAAGANDQQAFRPTGQRRDDQTPRRCGDWRKGDWSGGPTGHLRRRPHFGPRAVPPVQAGC